MPEVDYPNIAENSYPPLPDGEYMVKLESLDEITTKDKGDEMWRLKWKVVGSNYDGRVLWDNLVFSETGFWRVKMLSSRIGLDTSKKSDLTPDMILGKLVNVDICEDEYKGKKGNKIREYIILTDEQKSNMDDLPF